MSNCHRGKFTREFKAEAVKLITEKGYRIYEAACELGIDRHRLGRWRQKMERVDNPAFQEKSVFNKEKKEIERLRRKVKRLQSELDMLRKATAFFANLSR